MHSAETIPIGDPFHLHHTYPTKHINRVPGIAASMLLSDIKVALAPDAIPTGADIVEVRITIDYARFAKLADRRRFD